MDARDCRKWKLELALALLLPLCLLFVQQEALRHEIGHVATARSPDQKAPADKHSCALCLGYGQLSGAAKTDTFAPQLLASLSFGFAALPITAGASLPAPAARSRGPPTS